MSTADIIIVIVVSLILLAIILFALVLPRVKGKKGQCSSCPMAKDKKIKRALKDYRKSRK